MKYFVVEETRVVKPLYKSNFPFVKKSRWGQDSSLAFARIVKQCLFRRTIHLYVDDVESYRTLGGHFGARRVERFHVSNYPTWRLLTGISAFFLPEFRPAPIIRGGHYQDCYLIMKINHDDDLVTLQSELLQRADSTATLTEVTSVYCEYIKSWGITINKESAEREAFRAKKWFKARVRECNIRSLESAVDLIVRTLNASPKDSGIVRKSKAYDYHKLWCIAQEMFKREARLDDVSFYNGGFFFDEDTWNAAKCLYDLQGDYSYNGVYDDALISQLCETISALTKEAEYLSSGLQNGDVNLEWAKVKIKELRSELNEAGFPFSERGDTEYNWKRFIDIYDSIIQE